jgi:hypothetical protein
MAVIIFLLFISSLISLIVGLINPAAFAGLFKENLGRKKTGLVFAGTTFALFIMLSMVSANSQTSSSQQNESSNVSRSEKSPTSTQNSVSVNPSSTLEDSNQHAPATDISGYPGLTKVLIKASIVTNANGMIFTNNEKDQWNNCISTINLENLDSGVGNWYEYDFGDMSPGQSVTIPWNKLSNRSLDDGTVYVPYNATYKSDVIELSCELEEKTVGFARFQYK